MSADMYYPSFSSPKKHGLIGAILVLAMIALSSTTTIRAQELVWAKRAGGPGTDDGMSIAVDDAGNSYVTGYFQDSATFGLGEANQTTLSASFIDILVTKYDASGALVWAKRAG